jgi:hypothetical protein
MARHNAVEQVCDIFQKQSIFDYSTTDFDIVQSLLTRTPASIPVVDTLKSK